MKLLHRLTICILTWMAISSCGGKTFPDHPGDNSIYYWRTTFALNEAEKAFLRQHDVKKMYVRFFDVAHADVSGENAVPEATIQFTEPIPEDIEIVPTVYITINAMDAMHLREKEYASKILKRIKAICAKNRIDFKEVQLDCDWTKSNRESFFRLCDEMKSAVDSDVDLSSTIRLHQLTQSPPPVDKGVLMVYNTGNLMELTTENSIFSSKDIEPYLRHNRLANYQLPLDVAYPAYGWSLVFYPGHDRYHFDRIIRRTDFSGDSSLMKLSDNLFQATSTISLSKRDNDNIYTNYRIKIEQPNAGEIIKVKEKIEAQLRGKPHRNILYHLDASQLSHYSHDEISEIYSRY